MGLLISNLLNYFQSKQNVRILMIGLDAAGKTTILYRLKLGEVISTIPTIGFNVETIEYKNISFTVWDINGQQKIRQLWHHYIHKTSAIIFVVDSTDVERLDEVKYDLHGIMSNELLANAVLLVFANKQDMANALNCDEISKQLELHKVKQKWHVQASSATTGKGLYEGLDYLREMLEKK